VKIKDPAEKRQQSRLYSLLHLKKKRPVKHIAAKEEGEVK